MSRREIKHTRRKLTPEERERVAEARRLIAEEMAVIRRKAYEYKRAHEAARATRDLSRRDGDTECSGESIGGG